MDPFFITPPCSGYETPFLRLRVSVQGRAADATALGVGAGYHDGYGSIFYNTSKGCSGYETSFLRLRVSVQGRACAARPDAVNARCSVTTGLSMAG
ncbi:hypothetical protein CBR_g38218 [Chara braunii]|uniref:Uncharacterized protein n=1 Tax=Chara braunii TaxID=69332 RepID=A0A388LPJ0_CHABU|nr:hypothetical protein CBR_g38218 [Chara braunii]|eukprot:GBG84247.1 hypothetical protein CBR_g38218 [Chara braunii]